MPQILVHQPVDQFGDAPLDVRRRIGDDPLLELTLNPRSIHQVEDAADAQRVVEKGLTARLHVDQSLFDRRHAQLEATLEILAVERQLPRRRVQRLDVGRQNGEPIGGERLVSRRQRTADAERARQFQPEPLVIVQRLEQECFQWTKAAGRPLFRVAVLCAPGDAAR